MKLKPIHLLYIVILFALGYILGTKTSSNIDTFPVLHVDTIVTYDTTIQYIPNDIHHYHTSIDTFYSPPDTITLIDTVSILKDYYTIKSYNREWSDSNLIVNFTDTVYKCKLYPNPLFSYKIMRPTTIINNVTNVNNYRRYVYIGTSIPINNSFNNVGINTIYASPKGYLGYQYEPFNQYYKHEIKVGLKLLTFK